MEVFNLSSYIGIVHRFSEMYYSASTRIVKYETSFIRKAYSFQFLQFISMQERNEMGTSLNIVMQFSTEVLILYDKFIKKYRMMS